ncbi:hypothetical protein LZC95_51195 [Pendulispora brunnea]|uniref:Type II toxin-antitoxin system HicB family antitoxin n=1 Tax=Pendulispora brunnea TaxID=2905690 RepID=A0ABZ2KEJ0_9BACT
MNSLRNLPIVLQYEEDGTVLAHCPLVAGCECKAPTRTMALRAMEQILKRARQAHGGDPAMPLRGRKYEVVHLAMTAVTAGNLRHDGAGVRKPSEKPLQNGAGALPVESS